jgi:hypothetical protein
LLDLFGMLPAIDLDGEAQAWTIEVKRKRANRMLSPEVKAVESVTSKRMP